MARDVKVGTWATQRTAGHEAHGQSAVYDEATGKDVAIVYDGAAHAELIAAAPELLAALEDINDCLVKAANGANDLYDKNPDEFLDDLIDMASEAIRKATGGSTGV